MKYFLSLAIFSLLAASSVHAQQDKSKRASPPAKVSQTLASGATISIDYSQPSLKGRVIGSTVEPMKDKVWRMGANEATIFETDKDVTINGQTLPAGKYSLFGLQTDAGFTLIFNKAYQIWGTQYDQNKDKDALRVAADVKTTDATQEKLTYTIDKSGLVNLSWGNMAVSFTVK
jgi:Cu/Ag efflux protein CusF